VQTMIHQYGPTRHSADIRSVSAAKIPRWLAEYTNWQTLTLTKNRRLRNYNGLVKPDIPIPMGSNK